ncbi:GNAT family N-acetyltransferase [bacterium]|nr:GNAT family N-acetyltransferase [bacterium]
MSDPDLIPGLKIRFAKSSDRDLVFNLVRSYYAYDGIDFDAPIVEAGLALLLSRDDLGWIWLVELDGHVKGYAMATVGFDLEFGGRQATLTELFLLPESRGQGIGRRLLGAVEAELKQRGISTLELQVERKNQSAQAFYRALGYRTHDRIPFSKSL